MTVLVLLEWSHPQNPHRIKSASFAQRLPSSQPFTLVAQSCAFNPTQPVPEAPRKSLAAVRLLIFQPRRFKFRLWFMTLDQEERKEILPGPVTSYQRQRQHRSHISRESSSHILVTIAPPNIVKRRSTQSPNNLHPQLRHHISSLPNPTSRAPHQIHPVCGSPAPTPPSPCTVGYDVAIGRW